MNISAPQGTSDESIEQEIQAQIEGHAYTLRLDSSLSQFRTDPLLRPFVSERPLNIIFKIPCTDGVVEVPAQASFMGDIGNGPTYKLFGMDETQCQLLYNHLDNCVEGISVSREQLHGDKAPPLDVRDAQLLEKNREVTAQVAAEPTQKRKQWILSGFFLLIIGFFGWLVVISLYNIVSEDWGQQTYYTQVAAARLNLAEAQLKEVDANLDFSRSMLTKMHDPQYKSIFTPLQEEVFERDMLSLQAHEEQLKEIIGILKLNKSEVSKGNFFYERRVFDSFMTEDRENTYTTSAQLLAK
jgi:hypothetical protein